MRNPKTPICFILLLLAHTAVLSAQKQGLALIDSLENELPRAAADTTKIKLFYFLASAYNQIDMEESIRYSNQALVLAQKIQWERGIALAKEVIGRNHWQNGQFAEALQNHFESLKIWRKLDCKKKIAQLYIYIAQDYADDGNYFEALKNFLQADALYRDVANKPSLASLYSKIGACYIQTGDLRTAKQYFDKALSLNQELQSIGEQHFYYGKIVQYDSASGHWKNAFEHYKQFILTKDSIYNKENTKKMVQIRMQYDFDKKEAAAKAEQEKKDALAQQELRRQKLIRNGFMGGFLTVMLFAGVFFYQRNKIKKGKKRSDELLLNILPAEVAEELKAKGSADAKLIDEVTVLFSDFEDFTRLSETQTPEAVVSEINACFSAFDLIMQKHGVEKIKTVDDAYLAAGGLPVPHKEHAVKVLRAALDMQDFMQERKRSREAAGLFFFEARIGVHSGPVVAGIVGIKKFAYDIWGDTVNTAARMESSGEAGQINISETTRALVKDQFNCVHRGKNETKGKGAMEMYFVKE